MGKAIMLILIALAANVKAKELVADVLVDRASNDIVGGVLVDLDQSTLAKEGKGGGAAAPRPGAKRAPRPTPTPRRAMNVPQIEYFAGAKKPANRKVFGGTNSKTAGQSNAVMIGTGEMAIMKNQEAKGIYGGGQLQTRNIFGGAVAQKQSVPVPKIEYFAGAKKPAKTKLFGGTNSKTAGKPNAVMIGTGAMAVMKGKGLGLYGKR